MGLHNKIIKKLGINVPPKYQWLGSAILGVLVFLAMTIGIWLIISLAQRAMAGEVTQDGWLVAGETYFFIDQAKNDRTSFCRESRHDLTSNLGADLTLYKRGMVEWHTHLAHHSCAFGPDSPDYNAVGTGLVLRFVR